MQILLWKVAGLDSEIFQFLIIPLLIFLARVADVSINTIRIIYMLHGKKAISTVLGFFESLIWLLAISQIFQNINNVPTYFAYASGFAMGILVGMIIENKLALGRVVVRVITQKFHPGLLDYLESKSYRYSNVEADSAEGKVHILFTVIKRESLEQTIGIIKKFNPNAYYTVEGVKQVSDEEVTDERGFSFKKLILRK